MVSSTTPRLGPRCPPVLETSVTRKVRISSARGASWSSGSALSAVGLVMVSSRATLPRPLAAGGSIESRVNARRHGNVRAAGRGVVSLAGVTGGGEDLALQRLVQQVRGPGGRAQAHPLGLDLDRGSPRARRRARADRPRPEPPATHRASRRPARRGADRPATRARSGDAATRHTPGSRAGTGRAATARRGPPSRGCAPGARPSASRVGCAQPCSQCASPTLGP